MKKHGIALLFCVFLSLSCFGCGSSEPVLQAGSVSAVLNARMTEALLPMTEAAQAPASEDTEPPSETALETEAAAPDTTAEPDTTAAPDVTAAPDTTAASPPAATEAPEPTAPQSSRPPETAAEKTEPPETEPPETSAQNVGYPDVDIDLTMLSSTVVISQLNNMMVDPAPYFGYVVRLSGIAIVYSDGSFACLISDAGGCCQEAIHYSLRQGVPYPAEGSYVTIIGTFGTYYINDVLYCRLYDAVLES